MNEKSKVPESESYPVVKVVCDHCNREFIGKMGPVHSGEDFNLHIYKNEITGGKPQIMADDLPPEKRYIGKILLNHHYTVRDGSQGHYKFTVYSEEEVIGYVRVSTQMQKFIPKNPKMLE